MDDLGVPIYGNPHVVKVGKCPVVWCSSFFWCVVFVCFRVLFMYCCWSGFCWVVLEVFFIDFTLYQFSVSVWPPGYATSQPELDAFEVTGFCGHQHLK